MGTRHIPETRGILEFWWVLPLVNQPEKPLKKDVSKKGRRKEGRWYPTSSSWDCWQRDPPSCPAGRDTPVAARLRQWLGWAREGCSLPFLDPTHPYSHLTERPQVCLEIDLA